MPWLTVRLTGCRVMEGKPTGSAVPVRTMSNRRSSGSLVATRKVARLKPTVAGRKPTLIAVLPPFAATVLVMAVVLRMNDAASSPTILTLVMVSALPPSFIMVKDFTALGVATV